MVGNLFDFASPEVVGLCYSNSLWVKRYTLENSCSISLELCPLINKSLSNRFRLSEKILLFVINL